MRRSSVRRRVWEPAVADAGPTGLRFHDLWRTAATLAAASGTSLRADGPHWTRLRRGGGAAVTRYRTSSAFWPSVTC
jgi:hypothetical protein